MVTALVLSVAIGLSLGLLGGGGSILTVPILVYAAHLAPKTAIATSLLVVAVTSVAAVLPHARAGRVRFRTAFALGPAAMLGAFAGGRLAKLVPEHVLLVAFAVTMLFTAMAMLRRRKGIAAEGPAPRSPTPRYVRLAIEGAGLGLVTGLIGAGGGFLVVPALVLLGRMPMSEAVGTSLVVIAMNAFAGLAGYVGHVDVPWTLAAGVSGAAVLGAFAGSHLVGRVPEAMLRPLFGWFVVVMAAFVLGRELPDVVHGSPAWAALFVQRWPFWAGGGALGLIVLAMLWYDNKLLGVSTGCAELSQLRRQPKLRRSWRLLFLAGIALGGLLAALLGGGDVTFTHGLFDVLVSSSLPVKAVVLTGAGVLIGFGARTAGGCTSGHGIVGVALGARSSLVATLAFLAGGFLTTNLLFALRG